MSLPWMHQVTQIRQDWQRTMDTALEAGAPALLEWNAGRRQLRHLPALVAYHTWQVNRRDMNEPVMVTGQLDSTWPAPLVLFESHLEPGSPPPVQFIYGGADSATYMASLATQAAQRIRAGMFYAVDLPPAMQQAVAPVTEPHTHVAWQTLPMALFATANRKPDVTFSPPFHAATISASYVASHSAVSTSMNHASTRSPIPVTATVADPWLAWAALVMIVLLVGLALWV